MKVLGPPSSRLLMFLDPVCRGSSLFELVTLSCEVFFVGFPLCLSRIGFTCVSFSHLLLPCCWDHLFSSFLSSLLAACRLIFPSVLLLCAWGWEPPALLSCGSEPNQKAVRKKEGTEHFHPNARSPNSSSEAQELPVHYGAAWENHG